MTEQASNREDAVTVTGKKGWLWNEKEKRKDTNGLVAHARVVVELGISFSTRMSYP